MDGKTQGGLKLHTTMQPPETAPATEEPHVRWRLRQRKDRHGAPRVRQRVSKRTPGERLLRNTAIACALLLTVMALGNIDSPATNRVTNAIRGALSMDMSLDESLGKLSFVQNLVPESALVFLNIGGRRSSAGIPVQGETVHAFSEAQPWTEYKTTDAAQVRADCRRHRLRRQPVRRGRLDAARRSRRRLLRRVRLSPIDLRKNRRFHRPRRRNGHRRRR